MSNEITHNTESGLTLYACRFQKDGDVFITDGSSDEVWGTGGHDADNYDVTMTEEGGSGHYKGNFDASANIVAGVYDVVVRKQIGGNPADVDENIAQGEIYWNGTAEINSYTLASDLTVVDAVADAIKSDLIVVDGIVDTVKSDLIIAASDISYVVNLEKLQNNDWGGGGSSGGGTQGEGTGTNNFGDAGC